MRHSHVAALLAALVAAGGVHAQPESAQVRLEASVLQQRASAASMQASVARQRAAVEKQRKPAGKPAPFFQLAPPPRLGPPPGFIGASPAAVAAAPSCPALSAGEIDSLVRQAAAREDLDENMLRAVMRQESAFRPCAVSAKGAMGLMQLEPATATEFGAWNPFDPEENVDAGASFLKRLLVRYGGDASLALGAYNAGPSRVDDSGGVPRIPETQQYVSQILSSLAAGF
ncbi:MAG TPA: lytic transglycosylase domain-containing protein [Bryobacteraceae bacterium]|nr:lytic transglycosylase domain-containing protein [Bryobacteraceae bacterium]